MWNRKTNNHELFIRKENGNDATSWCHNTTLLEMKWKEAKCIENEWNEMN